jgi:hypothetical protein
MCKRCDETVRLLEETHDGSSVVAFSFPGGVPVLVKRPAEAEVIALDSRRKDDSHARG